MYSYTCTQVKHQTGPKELGFMNMHISFMIINVMLMNINEHLNPRQSCKLHVAVVSQCVKIKMLFHTK